MAAGGLVQDIGENSVGVVVATGQTMRFTPADLDIIDNPSAEFVSVAEQVVHLLKRDDLGELERKFLALCLRQQTFTRIQLKMVENLVALYENPE